MSVLWNSIAQFVFVHPTELIKCSRTTDFGRKQTFNVRQIGSTVVCLMSDSTIDEFTSWMPGSCDNFSKKNRS